jgi:hypothetical protein
MTSFAEGEWIEDGGYEKLWTEKLKEIVDKKIKTRRLCVISDTLYKLLNSSQTFSPKDANKVKGFRELVTYLESYYGIPDRRKTVESYLIRTNDNPELTSIKGFFAIMLSSGELHILHGETVNESGALTAKVLFDSTEIQKVHELFERYTRPSQELGKMISEISKQNGFLNYLKKNGIKLI